jgi:hypothetical protein
LFEMGKSLVFFIKASLLGLAFLTALPKEQYRKFIIYSIFLGGLIDIIVALGFSQLNIIKYSHLGPFGIYGLITIWTPLAWMFAFAIFLYHLPVRKVFFYPYVIVWAIFGVFVGEVLEGFGVYRANSLVMFFAFLAWFYTAAFAYMYFEKISLRSKITKT